MIGAMCRVDVTEIIRFAMNDKYKATEYALMVER